MKYLLQSGNIMAREKRIISKFIFADDVSYTDYCGGEIHKDHIPVGSVEFVNQFCFENRIFLPENISYPKSLLSFLKREVGKKYFYEVSLDLFVKPFETKKFTGGIKKNLTEEVEAKTPVWCSEPIEFESEFRFYILDKKILGYSRYDDGDNETIEPDSSVVNQMIEAFTNQPIGYAIDVGIVNGETVLVEVNDGWSLGYYPWGNISERDYFDLITERWKEIQEKSKRINDILRW